MSKRPRPGAEELHLLRLSVRSLFGFMLLLTLGIFAYILVKVFCLDDATREADFGSFCLLAIAALALCNGQLQCLKRLSRDACGRIETLTSVDELTGLYNYRYLEQRLTEELQRAKRHNCPLSIIYVDFDNFKLINDTFGHEAGNRVLQRVCRTARSATRGKDFVARVGGDELIVVLPQTDSAGALIAAERIKKKLDSIELVAGGGERIDAITFSMGIASYPGNADGRDELIRAADEAMYRAKKAGGDRVCI